MIIKTFNPITLEEKETVTQLESVIWNRRFYKSGSFEIRTTSDQFALNDIIAYVYNGEIRSGIVLKITENLKEYSVSGYDLKGIFNFRYITSPKEYTGTPETIIKTMAKEFLLPEEGDRIVNGLEISENSKLGEKISYTPKQEFLENAFQSFCQANEIGISVEFDLKKITLQTHIGTDRSELVRFGRKFHNIENIQYVQDLFNTYNVAYSVDEDENETVAGDAKGIMRRECYQKDNVENYLKEKAPIATLRGTASDKYKYGFDYFLGDYVTVIHKNLIAKKQITEIKEVHERNNVSIIPVFGTEKENPLKNLMKGIL